MKSVLKVSTMMATALGLLLFAAGCSTGPYSLEAQLGRRLGNIGEKLQPASLYRTTTRRVSNIAGTSVRMVRVPTRMGQMGTGITGAVAGEWHRTGQLSGGITSVVDAGTDRFDRAVRKFSNPPPAWVEQLSPTRLLGKFWGAIMNVGTVLGLDRPLLPMAGDLERRTDPRGPSGPTPNLWDRILYRLRL